ncbi:hypothetical protein HWB19_gp035 [Cronobacter phage vB_CsaP_009]|uniref:Uncharacterized protein n=1 Tax=Cronobacter phage vB_CsaP_009 TaxID=2699738 RepID=A0A679FG97_9CAUD|nr:hypothetical protein HWB19_gp035 [Cronobacter phage vB_CsaP_009]BBU72681.1 hypothetical protein [Cronobacter phage vB_CsaP_009]
MGGWNPPFSTNKVSYYEETTISIDNGSLWLQLFSKPR